MPDTKVAAVKHDQATINGFQMHYVTAGQGRPLVLLHGWPQSWYEWRKVIPALAGRYRIIAPDLRGLGDSDKPASGYDKRTLAGDVRVLLENLGIERCSVMGHDFGGVVAYFLCHDSPGLVDKLLILDVVPGLGRAGEAMLPVELAAKLHHVFFHGGNPQLAAEMIGRDVDGYIRQFFSRLDMVYDPTTFSEEELREYVRVNSTPGAIRAGCEYYATLMRDDMVNMAAMTTKIDTPLLVCGGGAGTVADLSPYWKEVATNVRGETVPECGHFIPEEKPEFVVDAAMRFFESATPAG